MIKKEQKERVLKKLRENFKNQKSIFLLDYKGLSANEIAKIRLELKKVNAIFMVAKKTLIKIAFENFEKEKFKEQVALVFGYKDEVSPAKILYKFSKGESKLNILGGYLENNFIDKEEVVKLAKLGSREELLGKLVFVIQSPISQFVGVLKGNVRKLVSVLNAIKETKT